MDMKVDSPGDMNDDRLLRSKAMVIGDDKDNNENEDSNSNAIDTDDDDVVVADPEDEEFGPPRKRLCRGTQSALSLALRGASITRCVATNPLFPCFFFVSALEVSLFQKNEWSSSSLINFCALAEGPSPHRTTHKSRQS